MCQGAQRLLSVVEITVRAVHSSSSRFKVRILRFQVVFYEYLPSAVQNSCVHAQVFRDVDQCRGRCAPGLVTPVYQVLNKDMEIRVRLASVSVPRFKKTVREFF